ncbi:MAG: hypothetical protein GWP56_07560 [Gammaproteobacteria bacterium]|jgi:hypothetical protein|nr:hypothetical protein [Gammaproteobacteria bacterium]
MSGHSLELRASFRYSGDDNHLDQIDAEVLTDQGWKPLQIENSSPGFLLFVYSFLICQHTYFHANSTERSLLLERASLDLSLTADEGWRIQKVGVAIDSKLRGGTADPAAIDHIKQRMRLCPVSVNLVEPPDYRINLKFS